MKLEHKIILSIVFTATSICVVIVFMSIHVFTYVDSNSPTDIQMVEITNTASNGVVIDNNSNEVDTESIKTEPNTPTKEEKPLVTEPNTPTKEEKPLVTNPGNTTSEPMVLCNSTEMPKGVCEAIQSINHDGFKDNEYVLIPTDNVPNGAIISVDISSWIHTAPNIGTMSIKGSYMNRHLEGLVFFLKTNSGWRINSYNLQ